MGNNLSVKDNIFLALFLTLPVSVLVDLTTWALSVTGLFDISFMTFLNIDLVILGALFACRILTMCSMLEKEFRTKHCDEIKTAEVVEVSQN